MPPKFKFTREEIVSAALDVVHKYGGGRLTARDVAKELGVSTQPLFTCFRNMADFKKEVVNAAENLYYDYLNSGLSEYIPFFGLGKAYIRFAKEEPEIYKFLFLTPPSDYFGGAVSAVAKTKNLVRPWLTDIYKMTDNQADVFFRNVWLVAHSIASLIVTNVCPYTDEEIGKILTETSLATVKAIKEIPNFESGDFNKDEIFKGLINK